MGVAKVGAAGGGRGRGIPSGRESFKPADPTRVRRHDALSHAQIGHSRIDASPVHQTLPSLSRASRHFSELQSPSIGQTLEAVLAANLCESISLSSLVRGRPPLATR